MPSRDISELCEFSERTQGMSSPAQRLSFFIIPSGVNLTRELGIVFKYRSQF